MSGEAWHRADPPSRCLKRSTNGAQLGGRARLANEKRTAFGTAGTVAASLRARQERLLPQLPLQIPRHCPLS